MSFRRLRYQPRGGPDGGDGGHGGAVYLRADPQLTTLHDFSLKPRYDAEDGARGSGATRTGRSGEDLYILVPCGTMIWRHPKEVLLGDLVNAGQTLLVARGGAGGRGNKAFATAINQTPRESTPGGAAENLLLDLELKLIADVGLTGLPNAGKSTLLRHLSRARPRVADYPFTTLHPHLGICELGPARRLVIADLPGLVEGAHRGTGLGHEFLRHVERTRVMAHLVSSEPGDVEALAADWATIDTELSSYSATLAAKPSLVVLTKLDLFTAEEGLRLTRALAVCLDRPVLGISAVNGAGVRALAEALYARAAAAGDTLTP